MKSLVYFLLCVLVCSCQGNNQESAAEDPIVDAANNTAKKNPPTPIETEQAKPDPYAGAVPDLGIPYTHEEMDRYRSIKLKIWQSRLGQMVRELVTARSSRPKIAGLISAITERIFSVEGEELIR